MSLENHETDEVSLSDIIDFVREESKTILSIAGLITMIGLSVAVFLPEKFSASAILEPAKVLGNYIEKATELAEKMRSPTYYSESTLEACISSDQPRKVSSFVKELNPNVGRQSAYVAVSIKAPTPELALKCINAVTQDVRNDQSAIAQRQIDVAQDRLKREELKLAISEKFVQSISTKTLADARKSLGSEVTASTLVFVAMQAKQIEIAELKNTIERLSLSLSEPQTKLNALVLPIAVSDEKVEPKRALITVSSLCGGLFLGLLIAFARRHLRQMPKRTQGRTG